MIARLLLLGLLATVSVRAAETINIAGLPAAAPPFANNDLFIVWDTSAPAGLRTRRGNLLDLKNYLGAGTVTAVTVSPPSIMTAQSSGGAIITITLRPTDPGADRIVFWDDSASDWAYLTIGSGLQIVGTTLSATGGGGGGSGTVTSADVTAPTSMFSKAGGPITTSGSIDFTFANVSPNTVWAGPATGGAGATVNRALVADDIPSIPASKITSGTISPARLGSGTPTASSTLYGDGSWGPLPSGDVPSARTITTTEGVQGGGDLSANRTLKLDIGGLTTDASPNVTDDFIPFFDTSGNVHRKAPISTIAAAAAFPADPNIPAVLGWVEVENARKYMAFGPGLGVDGTGTNIYVPINSTLEWAGGALGLKQGQDIGFGSWVSADLTESGNFKSTTEGKDGDTFMRRRDVVYPWMNYLGDQTSAITADAVNPKVVFRAPYAATITGARLTVRTAQSSGSLLRADIKVNGVSIFSTRVTVDNGEKTSRTAATADVIANTAIANDDEIELYIDQAGTGGAGPFLILYVRQQ